MKHLKDAGFINRKGIILKDPANIRKKPNNNIRNIVSNKAIYAEPNFFLRNYKFPFSKTSYNTISTNYESIDNKKSPKFKSIFNPIMESQIQSKIITLSPKSKNVKKKLYLPKMGKTYYNFNFNYNYLDKESKTLTSNRSDLKKSNSMISRNIFNMGNKKRFFSVNNCKSKINNNDNKYYTLSKFPSHPNANFFPKIYKKGFSQK